MRQTILPTNPYVYTRPIENGERTCLKPHAELQSALRSVFSDGNNLDLFGPKRTGKSTFSNLFRAELGEQTTANSTLVTPSAVPVENFADLMELLRELSPYTSPDRAQQSILSQRETDGWRDVPGGSPVDELVDLAVGITGASGRPHAIIIDGTEALDMPIWEELLASIRTLDTILKRKMGDPNRMRTISRLSWVLIGTRDVYEVYRAISGAATPFSPFCRMSIPPFSKVEVEQLAQMGFPVDCANVAFSIFERTSGYRCLTQRFLHEAFRALAAGARYDIEDIEEAVSQHEDPNWQMLLEIARESDVTARLVEFMANGEKVLTLGGEPEIRRLLLSGIFVSSRDYLRVGNSYYSRRVEKLWRTRPSPGFSSGMLN